MENCNFGVMVAKKQIISFIAIFVICCFILEGYSQNIRYKIDNRKSDALLIENIGQMPIEINEIWSQIFITKESEILQFINHRYGSVSKDYIRAWRFIIDYTYGVGIPLTHEAWYHHPLLFLNSAGFGFCDDKANLLAQIWEKMGYQTRVWDIESHVIPEVYAEGRWQIFDPTYHCFYSDSSQQILGMDELSGDKNYFVIKPFYHPERIQTYWAKRMGYSKTSANEFIQNKKKVEPIKTVQNELIDKTILPNQSRIIFPVFPRIKLHKTHHQDNSKTIAYAALCLSLPKGFKGNIFLPLIFFGAHSLSAHITFEGQNYYFTKKQPSLTLPQHTFPKNIKIRSADEEIQLFFLVNPLFINYKSIENSNPDIIISYIKLSKKNKLIIPYLQDLDGNKLKLLNKTARFGKRWIFIPKKNE